MEQEQIHTELAKADSRVVVSKKIKSFIKTIDKEL